MSAQEPIIVTGGSISVDFNPALLQGGGGRLTNQDKKITRVEVTGDGIALAENTPTGRVTVKIYCDNA